MMTRSPGDSGPTSTMPVHPDMTKTTHNIRIDREFMYFGPTFCRRVKTARHGLYIVLLDTTVAVQTSHR